jgi:hypothetical protein
MLTLAFFGGTAHTTEPHVDASSAFVAHGRPCSNSLSDRFVRSPDVLKSPMILGGW